MPKRMIEIDVPEGYEIVEPTSHIIDGDCYIMHIKKIGHEFIEVREYFLKCDGIVKKGVLNKNEAYGAEDVESHPDFFKWIDVNWRKVDV